MSLLLNQFFTVTIISYPDLTLSASLKFNLVIVDMSTKIMGEGGRERGTIKFVYCVQESVQK